MTVADPPFIPERGECQECHGTGQAYPYNIWIDQGEPCRHCKGTGKCSCRICQDLRP